VSSDSLTVPALLHDNATVHGDKPAIINERDSLSHAELDKKSALLARQLVASGVGMSSRVGLLMGNGIEWAVSAAAVMRVGAVLVPLSTLLKPPELHSQLETATVTELIATTTFRDHNYLSDLESVAPGIADVTQSGGRHANLPNLRRVWTTDDLPSDRVESAMIRSLEDRVRPADDLVIIFTSGSRGVPKGVIHTHGGAIRATSAGLVSRCVGSDERLYIPMPFFWTGGFSGGLMTALVAGATLITEAIPEAATTLGLLEREKVTLFRGWPDQATRLATHPNFPSADLTSLRLGSLPAVLPAGMRPEPGARANLFGMTETFGPYCGFRLDTDLPPGKHGSCGRPFEGIEVQIFDRASGSPCPPGVDGEIAVRGPNVMRGICGRSRTETFDAEGYYRTGDLGTVDADGYLWCHGRSDDMFKVKGATVYPSEVETALRGVDGVRQAFVTNIKGPAGEQVGALVVTPLAPDDLNRAVRLTLSSFKIPTLWYVTERTEDVPRTASDKVARPALQQLIQKGGVTIGVGQAPDGASEKGP
jgi:acyl-CoA synthetase (AMP-forming)/AMP-acid ligase II